MATKPATKGKKKKIVTEIKLQISGGQANPAPPVGPTPQLGIARFAPAITWPNTTC